jgi:hypothetical protein
LCAGGAGIGGCCCCEAKDDKVAGEGIAVAVSKDRGFCREPVSGRANVLANAAKDEKDGIGSQIGVVHALLGHSSRAIAAALTSCPPEAEEVVVDAIRKTSMPPSLLSPPDSPERQTCPRYAASPALPPVM